MCVCIDLYTHIYIYTCIFSLASSFGFLLPDILICRTVNGVGCSRSRSLNLGAGLKGFRFYGSLRKVGAECLEAAMHRSPKESQSGRCGVRPMNLPVAAPRQDYVQGVL